MHKLLTEQELHKVSHEYSLRRAIVVLVAFVFVFLVGIIGLLPSYLLSNIREEEAIERTKILESSGLIEDTSEAENWLKSTNQKLNALSPKLDKDRPSELIAKILSEKIAGISVTNIAMTKVKGKQTINVSGVARDRQVLVEFRDRVSKLEEFTDVILPVSNLAQDREISFQIKMTVATPKPAPKTQ